VNVPTRGIGLTSQQKIAQYAVRNGISNFAAATRTEELEVGTRAEKRLGEFLGLIEEFATQSQTMALNDWARRLVDRLGFIESYRRDATDESLARIDNIYELLSAIDEYCDRSEDPSLIGYMEEVSLLTDIDNYNRDGEQVTLMTLHSAKGLEFPIVFLAGMEDGLFPLQRAAEEPGELEEERRLFYVGITRAMQRAYLSAARVRQRYGELMVSRQSRFIDEIPVELLERVEEPLLVKTPRAASRSRSYDGGITRPSQRKRSAAAISHKAPDATYTAGMSVEHAFFGTGKIARVEGEGPDAKLTVVFQGNVQKKLIAKFANLKIRE
jgi:DNA helicase-2/ATP-dependent DNA helicase PcrA